MSTQQQHHRRNFQIPCILAISICILLVLIPVFSSSVDARPWKAKNKAHPGYKFRETMTLELSRFDDDLIESQIASILKADAKPLDILPQLSQKRQTKTLSADGDGSVTAGNNIRMPRLLMLNKEEAKDQETKQRRQGLDELFRTHKVGSHTQKDSKATSTVTATNSAASLSNAKVLDSEENDLISSLSDLIGSSNANTETLSLMSNVYPIRSTQGKNPMDMLKFSRDVASTEGVGTALTRNTKSVLYPIRTNKEEDPLTVRARAMRH